MKKWLMLLALGFGVGVFYNTVQERRKNRLAKRKLRLVSGVPGESELAGDSI